MNASRTLSNGSAISVAALAPACKVIAAEPTGAADTFDDEIHMWVVDQGDAIAREERCRHALRPGFLRIADGDATEVVIDAAAASDSFALVQEPFGDTSAYGPATE